MSSSNTDNAEEGLEGVKSQMMTQAFLRHYSLHQGQICAFVNTFFRSQADIDEVLQETAIVLWRKFDDFQTGTNFFNWACSVARIEVLRYMRINARKTSALPLDDSLVELLASERVNAQKDFDSHSDALKRCMAKLKQRDRELVQKCYQPGVNVKSIAELIDRPVNAVYQSLSRIRRLLHDCVTRSLKTGEM